MLSWQPVQGATSYLLQLARDAAFSDIVEAPLPQVPYYGPGQGSATALPSGIYWWRTRVETPAPGAWSEARRFHLAADLANGNPYDFVPPTESLLQVKPGYAPVSTIVSESPAEPGLGGLDLGPLHAILDRTIDKTGLNYHWVFAFGTTAGEPSDLTYTLLIDMDHLAGSGAPAHPEGLPLQIDPLFYPEYALVIPKAAGAAMAGLPVRFYEWGGAGWGVPQPLASIGGQLGYEATTRSLQVLLPYSSIGPEDPDHSGAAALFLVTSPPGSPIADSVPEQPGAILNRPVLVTDMLLPLFPFDTPLSNPRILRDPPAPRWALPWFDSVDGYQVQVARDAAFTKLVETWETYESGTWKYFEVAPATFASKLAYEDNESYYWRVRIRHERYTASQTTYDYGRWSPGLRFKLESRFPGTPLPAHGAVVYNTPTFTWQRVEGAAGYRLQVDNDANFTSPVFDVKPDGASYTPPGGLPDGTYYWRLAIRRADTVYGSWTAARSFTKASQAPALLAPSPDQVLSGQPAFSWSPVLTPTLAPRAAAPRYRLQFAADPNFTVPKTTDTDSTSYSPVKGQALDDGTWYVRVAVIDAWNRAGSYGAARRFYKEYPAPTLLSPLQGSSVPGAPSFEWAPLSGAAYYRIQIANNELFNGATTATTDATRFTPLTALSFGSYYWRVQMVDADGKPGPYRTGRVAVGFRGYLPVASKMR
jgi:hypothetical protein